MSDGGDGPTESSDDSSDTAISKEEMLEILSDRHRRILLENLATEADPTVSLDEAVTYVANKLGEQNDARPHEDDVKARLLHRHIPRLADSSLLEFDDRSETIRYHENEELEAFHEHVKEFEQE